MKKISFILLVLVAGVNALIAGGLGTTGGQFLKIGVGAKPLSMGGAVGAIANDINALYYNPAGIGGVGGIEIMGTYGVWFEDIRYEYLGITKSIPGLSSTIGVSALYLTVNDIPGYDSTGNATTAYGAVDMALGLTYALNVGRNLSVGVTGKSISQTIDSYRAEAYDFDVGVRLLAGPGIVFGCSVQNLLESEVKYDTAGCPLVRNIRAGVGYRTGALAIGGDVCMASDQSGLEMKFGGEYTYSEFISLRAGYSMPMEGSIDYIAGLCGGVGISLDKIMLDYALVPYTDLGLTHRVSVILKL